MINAINKKNLIIALLVIAILAISISGYGLINNYFALSANNTLLGDEPI
jgi:hypothetical protein